MVSLLVRSDRLFLSVTLRNNGNGLSRKQIIQGFDDFKALSGKVIDAMVLKTLKEKEEAKK